MPSGLQRQATNLVSSSLYRMLVDFRDSFTADSYVNVSVLVICDFYVIIIQSLSCLQIAEMDDLH